MKNMKTLTSYILENRVELDKTIKTAERRKVYDAVYKYLGKTGVTGKLYRDENWQGVAAVRKDVDDALKKVSEKTGNKYEVSIAADNGGYQKSKDGMSQWKAYKVEFFANGNELPFIVGTLNCHAAGSVDDPFDAYDMSFVISYN